jgi:AI-2 transport protein TqsA
MEESTRRTEQTWLTVGSLMVIATVSLAAGLIYTRVVLVPFVLAVFLAMVVMPVIDFLVLRCKMPQSLAAILALVLVVLFLALFGMFMIGAVETIVNTVGDYVGSFTSLKDLGDQVLEKLQAWNIIRDAKDYQKTINSTIKVVQEQGPTVIPQVLGTGAALIVSLIANGLLITFFSIFLLAGRNSRHKTLGLYKEIETAVRRYIITKFAISAVTGLLVWLVLSILGLRMAFVFGFLTFLLNLIPNIGSIIATILPLPLAIAQFDHVWPMIAVVAIPGALAMVIGNAIEPKLLGRGLELHPVTILFALAFWGLLWGYMGMVLAVPITAIIRIVLIRFETTRALGQLLGGKLPGQDVAT